MDLLQAIILGVVQGLTEFIPVSSTAHLILVQKLMGWHFPDNIDFAFNVLIQLGTTAAVIVYFWRDLWRIALGVLVGLRAGKPFEGDDARLGWLVVLATVPAVVVGLLFKNAIEALHEQPLVVAGVLVAASAILWFSERIGKRTRPLNALNWLDALVVGVAQAVALIPGVSRSGASISGALLRDIDRSAAARFSFLMSVPALVGASVLAMRELLKARDFAQYLPAMTAGFIAAAIVGFASIHWLLAFLSRRSMNAFAVYRVIAGALFFAVIFLRG
ncbi:MAG: undecaprenyl-diphosphatase UppP [Chloroflexi bacterium]|nr:undecaprenyl-diphosphatase UppP [Chloroflexota bacterium]